MFRPLTLAALLAACISLLALPAFSAEASQGNDSVAIEYSEELRFGDFMDRVYTIMTSEQYFGAKYPEVRKVAEIWKQSGLFNLTGTSCRYRMDNENIEFYGAKHYTGLDPAGVPARYQALPDVAPVSARYLSPGSYTMYMSLQNVPAMAALTLEQLEDTEVMMKEMGLGEMGLSEMFGHEGMPELSELAKIVDQLQSENGAFGVKLSGEVAAVVYSLPSVPQMTSDNFDPLNSDLDVALMLGIKDSEGIVNAMGLAGPMAGLSPGVSPGPGWMRYDIAQMAGAGVIFNDEILIASNKVDLAIAHCEQAMLQGRMQVEPCQLYMDVNLSSLHRNTIKPGVDSMLAWTRQENPEFYSPLDSAAYLFALPDDNDLGHFTMGAYNAGGYHVKGSMRTAVVPYAMYYASVAGCTIAQTEMSSGMDYQEEDGASELDGLEAEPAQEAAPAAETAGASH